MAALPAWLVPTAAMVLQERRPIMPVPEEMAEWAATEVRAEPAETAATVATGPVEQVARSNWPVANCKSDRT